MIKAIFSDLFDFLYPKSGEIYELESLPPEELIVRLKNSSLHDKNVITLFSYVDPNVRTLIWELKYRKNQTLAKNTACVAYDVLKAEIAERALFENFSRPLLVPMPMSNKRRAERGYNQTEVLCEEIMKCDDGTLEYAPKVLKKIRHTESQTLTKEKRARLSNLEHSMEALPETGGRNVIVVDDVTTSGASFNESRRALKLAGAKKIICFALAH